MLKLCKKRVYKKSGIKNLFFWLLVFTFLFSGCGLLNFQVLDIYSSLDEVRGSDEGGVNCFEKDYLEVRFSLMPDKDDFERVAVLKKNGAVQSMDFLWESDSCKVRPEIGWKKGFFYSFCVDGSLKTVNSGCFDLNYNRQFYYGNPERKVKLEAVTPGENDEVEGNEALVFDFSVPVTTSSFLEGFSLSPYVDYKVEAFEKEIRLTPEENWPVNTVFNWRIAALETEDGYGLCEEETGVFKSVQKEEGPVVLGVHQVLCDEGLYVWKETALEKIRNGDGIGVRFSCAMETESLKSGISFYPSLKGELLEDGNDGTKFVYVPEGFVPGQKYRMVLSGEIRNQKKLSMFDDYEVIFSNSNEYLEVEEIRMTNPSGAADFVLYAGDEKEINTAFFDTAEDAEGEFVFKFSTAIPKSLQFNCEKCISASLVFPSSAAGPALISVKWNSNFTELALIFSGFTVGSAEEPVFYKVKVCGGENGIKNAQGEYLEEDLCVVFESKNM